MMRRRLFLASLAAVGCRRPRKVVARTHAAPSASAPPPPPVDPRANLEVLDWELGDGRCVVLVPKFTYPGSAFGGAPDSATGKLPLLIALHGMGETTSPAKGAYGWLDSYQLDRALQRLRTPPLDSGAFQGLVTDGRLAEINTELAKRPYGGLVIACPYLPRGVGSDPSYEAYGKWLGERLLPKLRNETPVIPTVAATGIDGVSLGGITALRIGLARPDLFGAVGALQPAVNDEDTADALATTIADTLAGRPLRIVTSTDDAYRAPLEALDRKLWDRKVPHQFFLSEGPHDYVWNQGPGAIEMALWHDRVLRA